MKKTYLTPTIEVVPVKMTQKLCMASLKTNADLGFGGEMPVGFDSDDIR